MWSWTTSGDLNQLKSGDLNQLKSGDLGQVKSGDLGQLKSGDLGQLKSGDLFRFLQSGPRVERLIKLKFVTFWSSKLLFKSFGWP